MINTSVEFKINGKRRQFNIIHNLPETKGANINDAVDCWLARTGIYTAKSLCEYIHSKGFLAYPIKES